MIEACIPSDHVAVRTIYAMSIHLHLKKTHRGRKKGRAIENTPGTFILIRISDCVPSQSRPVLALLISRRSPLDTMEGSLPSHICATSSDCCTCPSDKKSFLSFSKQKAGSCHASSSKVPPGVHSSTFKVCGVRHQYRSHKPRHVHVIGESYNFAMSPS